jgi:hypothetical protein
VTLLHLLQRMTATHFLQNKRRLNKTTLRRLLVIRIFLTMSMFIFLSVPLGKPPHIYGEDYSWWSHNMSNHLFSLHSSIWDVVENGMHVVHSDDENSHARHDS